MSYLESLFSLRAKNALITGAASGLGFAPRLQPPRSAIVSRERAMCQRLTSAMTPRHTKEIGN